VPPPYTIYPTSPNSDRSTADTVVIMYAVIEQSYRRPEVIAATREACSLVGMYDPAWRKAEAIWEWVHANISFMSDEEILVRYFGLPDDLELIQRPELLLFTRAGDCDCFTTLTASMLKCAGVTPRIVTIAADSDTPRRWSHVYGIAVDEAGKKIPMDTSHGRYFGWEAPRWFRRQEWVS
jgi:transglutaminase-like putative cysteine protease